MTRASAARGKDKRDMRARRYMTIAACAAAVLLTGCEGIMSGLYDEPDVVSEYGFTVTETTMSHGTIYINCAGYTHWVYLNFEAETADSVDIVAGMEPPAEWDLAVHRYDPKTNGGSVAMTDATDIDDYVDGGDVPADGAFVADVMTDSVIATDMSGMMDGVIVYTQDYYNTELAKWLDVDTSTMPPIYTKSDNVFVLRTQDGRMYALRLENYMGGDKGTTKGYMTIEYRSM